MPGKPVLQMQQLLQMAEDSASDETLSSDGSMTHPVHDYCQEELDSVELDFRIDRRQNLF